MPSNPFHDDPRCFANYMGLWLADQDRLHGAISAAQAGLLPMAAARNQEDAPPPPYELVEGLAVIGINGFMMKRDSKFGGATSTRRVVSALRQAQADPEVRGAMLLIESPGGHAEGTNELARAVEAFKASKPIHAHIEDLGASAAYWVASQAGLVTANETAEVGSIGVVAVVQDLSGMAAREGIKVHVISTGPLKGAGAPGAEITHEQLAAWQERVDDIFAFFKNAVMRGRAMSEDQFKEVSSGRVWSAYRAQGLRLIDGIASREAALDLAIRSMPPRPAGARSRAAASARIAEAE